MRIHSILPSSKSNGKGTRLVIWTQGCSLLCKGCFNPKSHSFSGGNEINVDELMEVIKNSDIDGVTISGGEPFDQKEELLNLVSVINDTTNLNIIVYSGYNYNELCLDEMSQSIIQKLDALITGAYIEDKKTSQHLYGSTNQEVILITNKFVMNDFIVPQTVEIIIHNNGLKSITGFPTVGVF